MHIKVLSTNTVGSTFHPNRYSSWNQMKSSSLILSGNEINSWEMIRPQLCGFPYHFAVISFIARNRILKQRVIGGEHRPCLGDLPQLPVELLYGIGGVDVLPYLIRVPEERGKLVPVVPPALHRGVILPPPFRVECIKLLPCLILCIRLLDLL